MSANFDLIKIDAFDDAFTQVVQYLNPKEHCQTSMVCKKLNTLIEKLWQQQKHNIPENREWLMNLYLTKIENNTGELKEVKKKTTYNISKQFFQIACMPQNAAGFQRIAEIGEERLFMDISLKLEPLVNQVVDMHQDELLSSLRRTTIQSFSKYFSLAQIKSFIDSQNDPFNRSLLLKSGQMQQPSFALTKKWTQLNEEMGLELENLAKLSDTEAKLPKEFSIPKKHIRNEQLINIDINEWKEDTKENRLRCIDLLCGKTEFLATAIEDFKQGMISTMLMRIALHEKVNVDALSEKKVSESKELFDQAFNSKFDLIHSLIKEAIIEKYGESGKFSIEEIKRLIERYQDPLQLSVIKMLPQVMQDIEIANQKFGLSLMREIYTATGLDVVTIDALCGEV